jgi:phytoene dehydrogenase-like protein
LRYDACIIGAGADGLAAAATLAGRGLKVAVVERDSHPGGRCATREFHPGFRASPYADELPPIPADIFWSLDLARRGALLAPVSTSLALWPGRQSLLHAPAGRAETLRRAIFARVLADAAAPAKRGLFAGRAPYAPWPGEEFSTRTLLEAVEELSADSAERAHLLAAVLDGGVCNPALAGSALQLLGGARGGMAAGGLGGLGEALRTAAAEAGAVISCGLEATDLKRKAGRVTGVGLADGSDIAARAVISTLDLKRTFLSLFSWSELPKALVDRVGACRPAPGTARLLLALDAPPEPPAGTEACALRGPIHLAPGAAALDEATRAWRRSAVPERPPAMLRLVSAIDPSLAPPGAATLTVTLGAIPHTPFDGAWTHEKRDRLRATALATVEILWPGIVKRVLGSELILPADMEQMLGISGGDLTGGELAADQMLGLRPFADLSGADCRGSRTPVEGLYLAGPSSALGPLATCAAGVAAARAVAADLAARRI